MIILIVNLITKKDMNTVILPEKVVGQYYLCWEDKDIDYLIEIEAIDEKWILKSNKKVHIIDENASVESVQLMPMCIYWVEIENERYSVFTESESNSQSFFTKYYVESNFQFSIGRNEDNDIIVNNSFVSGHHAFLEYNDGTWFVKDNNSTNYLFVNGKRINEKVLKHGDLIYIMGLKLIIGGFFISINNPEGQVYINTNRLKLFENFDQNTLQAEDNIISDDFFYRSPRFNKKIEKKKIKIDPPPQSPIGEELPLILTLGPSMTMGMASMVTAINAVNNAMNNNNFAAAIPSLAMSVSMLLGTILWPTITKKYDKKRKQKKEKQRQDAYRKYLSDISNDISRESHVQEYILSENFIKNTDCINIINSRDRKLWERTPGQDDFLQVSVGRGMGELDAEMAFQERRFTIEHDVLLDEMYELCESPKTLKNIPITYSLLENYISGVIGDRKKVVELVKSLILQIITYYSYNEVKLAFIYDEYEDMDFSFCKWLPHVWSRDKKFRLVSCTKEEVNELSSYLEKILEPRLDKNDADIKNKLPYYIVFAVNRALAIRSDALKKIYANPNVGFTVVTLYDNIESLPKECSAVVEVSGMKGRIFNKDNTSGGIIEFEPEVMPIGDLVSVSKKLMNTQLDERDTSVRLPTMLTFLEMYGVGRIEHLNILARWKENDPTISLEAPIGVDSTGRSFKLNLHEKYHGPHGLVAGMTGSGKSEFIITYILSMAVNYHPDEVAFILIDYKGGGLAGAFCDSDHGIMLPHLAGTITNLDGASINRSLISIQSELRRRQAIFNEAKRISNEGTMDIYKYQKLYRRGVVNRPVPHLFIISDEFAELKTQQPEFMEQLISAARIGRSLGVHLILATQKPNGVVDDQIWSNSRFRVCLKVQEKADSMDMIKRPDAAEIAETGRFYLQVGFNEFFDMGQSAWCGAPYVPGDRFIKRKNDLVTAVNNLGEVIAEAKVIDNTVTGNESKELVELVKYLSILAAEEKVGASPLWLDPIPEKIYIRDLEGKYSYKSADYILDPIIGEYDDPFNQRQDLFTLPLSKEGHAIIYGASGSGVETAVSTVIYSLISHHNAQQVNIYAIDFGSETLTSFSKAPQVGEILVSSDSEKIVNLFKMIREEVAKRKKLFSEFGGNYDSYIENSNSTIASIIVIIDNFAVFAEEFNDLEDEMVSITRDCQKYGIYFVITANSSNAVRYRLQQNFKQLMVLQMNDTSDYVSILGQTDGIVPSKLLGRGIVKIDRVYEFQTACISDTKDTMNFIRSYCGELLAASDVFASKVPVLPKIVGKEFVAEHIRSQNSIPVGVYKNTLEIASINLTDRTVKMVLSEDLSDTEVFIHSLAETLDKLFDRVFVVGNSYQMKDESYETVTGDADDFIDELFEKVVQRHNTFVDSNMDESALNDCENIAVLFYGMKSLRDSLNTDQLDKLNLIMDKTDPRYRLKFIVADSSAAVRSYSIYEWYKSRVGQNEGIWIGAGLYLQNTIKLNRNRGNSEEMESSFGYVVDKGKERLAKFLDFVSDDSEVDYE